MPPPTHEQPSIRPEARVGVVLRDKWRLERLLGVGGMAAVYSAVHRNGNRVAIKLLHPSLSGNEGIRTRFLREGYVANQIDHPGLVRVLDDDAAEDGAVFLVMDLLLGAALGTVWRERGKRLAPEIVIGLAHPLLDVLAAAHARAVVHRDIKPDNVFLTTRGEVKLLDFGVAQLREAAGDNSMTRTGTTMGTPAYMSPEQALGRTKAIDAQSDVYSVGALVFALLSGRYVHEGETMQDQLIQAATVPAPSLAAVAPDVPPALAAVVDGAIAFEKEHRWASAAAMRDALAAAQRQLFGRPVLSGADLAAVLPVASARDPEAELLGASALITDGSMIAPDPSKLSRPITAPPAPAPGAKRIAGAPPARARGAPPAHPRAATVATEPLPAALAAPAPVPPAPAAPRPAEMDDNSRTLPLEMPSPLASRMVMPVTAYQQARGGPAAAPSVQAAPAAAASRGQAPPPPAPKGTSPAVVVGAAFVVLVLSAGAAFLVLRWMHPVAPAGAPPASTALAPAPR